MISHAVRIFFEKKISAGVPYHFWLILAHFGSLKNSIAQRVAFALQKLVSGSIPANLKPLYLEK